MREVDRCNRAQKTTTIVTTILFSKLKRSFKRIVFTLNVVLSCHGHFRRRLFLTRVGGRCRGSSLQYLAALK